MRMSPDLVVSSVRSLLTQTIRLRNKPVRSLALLALIAIAATASAATSSSAQLLFGKASAMVGLRSTAAPAIHAARVNATLMSTHAPLPASDRMLVERRGYPATRLSNGTVLIAGGENSSGPLNECEIYDPASLTFSVTGNMGAARADHSATLLADGRVLIAGGHDAAGALNTTEIFDPTTGAFASGPAMSVARAGHSATLFADGRVFVAGGDANGSAEIFDPSTGTFSAAGANMNDARSMHSAALLADGRVLLVGGRNASGDALSSGEIFDGASFVGVGGMVNARVSPLMRVLFDGKVQIIGGNDDGSMEIYDPAYGIFGGFAHGIPESNNCSGLPSPVLSLPKRSALFHNNQSDPLFDRIGQTITEMNGQALVLGGANSSGAVLSSSSVLARSAASITTDKIDYVPGQTALISGRGFQAGETVRVKIHEDPHTPQQRGFDAVADADGNFSGEYVVQDYDQDMKFIVGGRGLTSGVTAQTTFTDAVSVTAATGGTNISADNAANATSPVFTALGNIVITEGATTDFADTASAFKTLILTAPSGWTFNAGVGSVSAMGGRDIVNSPPGSAPTINVTSSTITASFIVTGTTKSDVLTISGIQVRATNGASLPSSGNILRTAGNPGTAVINGIINGTTNFGSLSQVAGAVNSFLVESAAGGNIGTQTAGTSFNIKVTARDQFNNTATTFVSTVNISSTGTLSAGGGTTPAFVAGVLATRSVTISNTGNFTITATRTSGGAQTGTSNSFDVNPAPLASFAVTNTSNGPIGTQTAGTAFNIKVRAIDALGNTVTSFDGGPNKVMITSTGTLAAYSGVTTGSLLISNPTVSLSGNKYQAVFTNTCVPATATSTAATLTVNPKALTVTATNQNKTYGTAVTPAGTEFTTTGLINSDTVTSVTLTSGGYCATTTVARFPRIITTSPP